MPRVSKLVAAVIFAAVAYYTAEQVKLVMAESIRFGLFSAVCAVIGMVLGWRGAGGRQESGYVNAISNGLRTSFLLVVWSLLFGCIVLMIRKAFRKLYDTPLEAVTDVFKLVFDNAPIVLEPTVLIPLALGGIFGGLITLRAKQLWD